MSARTRIPQAALAAGLAVGLLIAAGALAAAQEDSLCGVLTADDLAAAVPGTYDPPSGATDFCQWHGVADTGRGVDVVAYTLPGSASDMPGAESIDIGGRPAFSMTDPVVTPPTHAVGVESGTGVLLVLTVGTDDESLDLPAVAMALTTRAVENLESGAVAPMATASTMTSAPGASAVALGNGLCDRATPEEIAAAAGLDGELTEQDLEVACSWEAVSDEGYVLIYVAQQDPGFFEAMIGSLDAEEIDGPGEQDWWAGELASLFSRQGDLVLQVSLTSSAASSEEEVKQATVAIMTALLAP